MSSPDALKANVLPAVIGLKPAEDPSTHFEDRVVKRDLQLSDLSRRAGEGAQPPRGSQRNDGTNNHPPYAGKFPAFPETVVKPPSPTGTTEVFHAPEGLHTSEFTSSSPFHQGTTFDGHALHRAIRLPGSVPNPGAATGSHFSEPFPLGTYSSNNPNPNPNSNVHHELPATNSHFAGHSNVGGLQNPNPDVHHAAMDSHFAGLSDVHGHGLHAAVETIPPLLDFGTHTTPTTMGAIGWQPHHTDALLSSLQSAPARPPSVGSSIWSGSTQTFASPSSAHPGTNPTDPSLAHHRTVATGQPPAAPHLGTNYPQSPVALDLEHLYGHPNRYEPLSGSFGIPLDGSSHHLGSAPSSHGLQHLDPDLAHLSQFGAHDAHGHPITHLSDHLNTYPHSDGGVNNGGHINPHTPVVAHASESNHGSLNINSPSVHGFNHDVEDGAHASGDLMDGHNKLGTPHGEVDMYPELHKSEAYSSHPMKEFGVPGAHGHDIHTGSPSAMGSIHNRLTTPTTNHVHMPVTHDDHHDLLWVPHAGGAGDINPPHVSAPGHPPNLDQHAGYPHDTSSLYSGHSSLASNAGSLPVTSTTGIEGQGHDLFSDLGAWDPHTPSSHPLNDFGFSATGAALDLHTPDHNDFHMGPQGIDPFTGTNVADHDILGTMGGLSAHHPPAPDHSLLNTGTYTIPHSPTDPHVAGRNQLGTTHIGADHHDLLALDHSRTNVAGHTDHMSGTMGDHSLPSLDHSALNTYTMSQLPHNLLGTTPGPASHQDLHDLDHIGSHVQMPSNTGPPASGQHSATGIDVNHATHHASLGTADGAQHRWDTLGWPGMV
ncbi:hypothetical protein H0H93_012424 [Arthromyces matolae]|nr:hypothetical protein H0H93_012424 [Arthromyces matolae]